MAEVMDLPVDSVEGEIDVPIESKDNLQPEDMPTDSPPPLPRRREKDSRERRDDRDADRPSNRRGGDYYDRNRSPPPQIKRDRDFKRRLSPSPPPFRDRRPYSPSRRSPPFPSFKRSRREDGGYDGRRGSPRQGYGNDRRFGFDHPGGYDRDMNRSGRYFGRSSGGYPGGRSDWDPNRGGYNSALNTGNVQREGLMSYKQFMQELEDDVLPSEAERRYQEYKTEYITTQKRTYFEAHKDEEWLRNKYHPTNLVSVIERRNELARNIAKNFLTDLHTGELNLGPSTHMNKSDQANEHNSEDDADGGIKRPHGRKGTDLNSAPKAPSVSSDPRRIRLDVELALALARKLDSEKGIDGNILSRPDNEKINRDKSHGGSMGPVIIVRGSTSVKGLEGVELLDTLVTYLWRVHGVDYYGMIESTEPKGLRHVRTEGKDSDANNSGIEWESKLDSHWKERVRNQDPLEIMTAKEKIDAAAGDALDPYVRKIRDEKYGWKYGCGAKGCTKLFHAPEFVQKHLKLKHIDLLMECTTKIREDLYFQNYMNDSDAPGSQPVMQQTMKRENLQRRRNPLENRLKDDRPGNGSETDFQSNNDDPEKGNDDGAMYDNYNGQHIHVPPFGQDMPPQVLMPVPGAGPLGPFVPAPPDVAMRMIREQGGPPSLEHGGGGGRSGRPPIILPPNFREDPRRLRSYQDLDAPEDEVTVIDYRSL